MVLSFSLDGWKVIVFLETIGSEFQTTASLYVQQLWPCFACSLGDLYLVQNREELCLLQRILLIEEGGMINWSLMFKYGVINLFED